jgi:hypothetical protein
VDRHARTRDVLDLADFKVKFVAIVRRNCSIVFEM